MIKTIIGAFMFIKLMDSARKNSCDLFNAFRKKFF